MKKFKFYFLAISLGLFVMLNGCSKDEVPVDLESNSKEIIKLDNSLTRAANNPSASGQGELIFPDGTERHFAFQVRTKKNGSVKGSGQLTYSGGLNQTHFNIDCIQTMNLNVGLGAFMSGTITSSSVEEAEGLDCFFFVADGGEEDDLNPDIMSFMLVGGDAIECSSSVLELLTLANNMPYDNITGGNIQVNDYIPFCNEKLKMPLLS
jgi:hypothetical protein